MKLVNTEEMRKIDNRTIQEFNIPSIELMERAGTACVENILKEFSGLKGKKVGIFVGKGNNGGDGLVIARLLANKKIPVKVFLVAREEDISDDAKINLNKLFKIGIKVKEINSFRKFEKERDNINGVDIIVDALLGTGFKGAVTGLLANIIDYLNTTGKPIIAVDLPSGLNVDLGNASGSCINADLTITLGLPKFGLFMYPGVKYAGRVVVGDIGIPDEIIKKEKLNINLTDTKDVLNLLPKRELNAHKGSVGKVLIVGGSIGLTGAVALTSQAVLRSGAGMAILAIPESLNQIMETKLTEVITKPIPETKNHTIALSSEKLILELANGCNAIALGPGLGRNKETDQFVKKIIQYAKVPIVLDADGLNAIVGSINILKQSKVPLVLTPHPGEMARLINSNIEEVLRDRFNLAREFAIKNKVILVLKGSYTVIADFKGELWVNSTGNSGMATAGTGDVLTGIIASLIAQGLTPIDASIAGVYIHGLA